MPLQRAGAAFGSVVRPKFFRVGPDKGAGKTIGPARPRPFICVLRAYWRAAATAASRMSIASAKCASGMVIGAKKRTTLP